MIRNPWPVRSLSLVCLLCLLLPTLAAVAQQVPTSAEEFSRLPPAQQQKLLQQYQQGGLSIPQADPSSVPDAPPIADSQVVETELQSFPVFGQSLFQGHFALESFRGFNPDYVLSVGDIVDLRLWGAFELQLRLAVDAQGNIFVPKVGPIAVEGVRNADLNKVVGDKLRSIYREDVGVYASLATAVPVKVFVSGSVRQPGLYPGYSSDTVLNFLDRAGGVDPVSGSYLDVRLLRGGQVTHRVNLYDFLTTGLLPQIQLHDGDSLFVGPIGSTAKVSGLVANPVQFEFTPGTSMNELLQIAGVNGRATNVRILRNSGEKREAFYVPIGDPFLEQPVQNADEIEVTADRQVGKIAVSVDGEHKGAGHYVLPFNATLADLLERVEFSDQSRRDSLQLFRVSVAERQKQVIDEMLRKIEQSVLAARSATTEEAALRTQEAQLVLQFVSRARQIKPLGQVVLSSGYDPSKIILEDGDVVRIPRLSSLVAVHGEVYLPNSFVWRKGMSVEDYVREAGGVVQESADDRVLLMRPSGEVILSSRSRFFGSAMVNPGDEILVLPAVDSKELQFTKDIVQVVYQIAVAAGVLIRL